MSQAMGARQAVMAAILKAKGGASDAATAATEWRTIPRDYESKRTLDNTGLVALLKHRLEDYDAGVYSSPVAGVSAAVAEILRGRDKHTLAVPAEFEQDWLPEGFAYLRDNGLSAEVLEGVDGVITSCAVAIAETGSLVLLGYWVAGQNGQGRRILTLVPDYHLCVVRVEQVVQTVPEAFARLAATPTLPATFISGPSATADIEMTRIKGVHGPRFLDVLLVE